MKRISRSSSTKEITSNIKVKRLRSLINSEISITKRMRRRKRRVSARAKAVKAAIRRDQARWQDSRASTREDDAVGHLINEFLN